MTTPPCSRPALPARARARARLSAALALASLPAPAPAQPVGLADDEKNTIAVFEEASPSVVFIQNKAVAVDLFSMAPVEQVQGTGSGFVWDERGHVVTNLHVVQGGSRFTVLFGEEAFDASLRGYDPKKDIAVLRLEPASAAERSRLRALARPLRKGRSDDLRVGQKVLAIGAPFQLDRTLTVGVVSALGRRVPGIGGVEIRDMIQTDAAINPGSSGGPLLDSRGRLIGMNTQIVSPSGAYAGVAFAVPYYFIERSVTQIVDKGYVTHPTIGVYLFDDSFTAALRRRGVAVEGVIVQDVAPGSDAERAGLRGTRRDQVGRIHLGDILVGIDGQLVRDYDDLYNALDRHRDGDTVTVHFLRDGKRRSASVRLEARPER